VSCPLAGSGKSAADHLGVPLKAVLDQRWWEAAEVALEVDETPARPGESVHGQDGVRENFARLFADLPDLTASISRAIPDGDTVWMEWRMRGTRADGTVMDFVGSTFSRSRTAASVLVGSTPNLSGDAGGIDGQIDRMTKGTS
jgi:SnoaL-like domain